MTAIDTTVPLPIWDDQTEGYWKAAKEHILAVRKCSRCGAASFPPWACCRQCNSMEQEWAPTAGTGTIYTWTVVHRSTRAEFQDQVPFALAVVELDDYPGVLVPARYPASSHEEMEIGTPVRAEFETVSDDVNLLRWVPRDAAGAEVNR